MKKKLIALAIRLLARRNYSCYEMEKKLLAFCNDKEEVNLAINFLKDKKLISDEDFTERLVSKYSSNYGSYFIYCKMKFYGIDPDIINKFIPVLKESDFYRASALYKKKFYKYSVEQFPYFKRARFLESRGFSSDVIYKILSDISFDHD